MTGEASPRQRFAATVREDVVDLDLACLLVAADLDPSLGGTAGIAPWLARLDELASRVPRDRPPVDALRTALGSFHGDPACYGQLGSSLLPDVLRLRRGLPILLSVVWIEVGRRCGIPVHGVGLPGHFVVRVEDGSSGSALVDPFAGGSLWRHRGRADLEADRPWEPLEILQRVLANVRAWGAGAPERTGVRLAAVELALLLPHHSLSLRRERGELLLHRGDFLGGAAVLEAYAATVADVDPTAAELARAQARLARARLN